MARPSVILREHADDNADWRRFVAVLCFLEFYSQFVLNGSLLWGVLHPGDRIHLWFEPSETWNVLELGAELLRAFAFFIVGRGLWQGSRRVKLWTVACVAASLLTIAGVILEAALNDYYQNLAGFWSKFWAVLAELAYHVIWLAVLIAAWSRTRASWSASARLNGWVWIAVVWTAARLFTDCTPLLPHPGSFMGWGHAQDTGLSSFIHDGFSSGYCPRSVAMAVMCTPLLLILLLLLRARACRMVVLVMAGIEAAYFAAHAPIMPYLVLAAITALFHSLPGTIENPYNHFNILLNKWTFLELCVRAVGSIAPWLLIAHFCRTRRMTAWPDDGSPWPRRYCGKCHYNLHGVKSDQCPECGQRLELRPQAAGQTLEMCNTHGAGMDSGTRHG